jgi:hypothetical protein
MTEDSEGGADPGIDLHIDNGEAIADYLLRRLAAAVHDGSARSLDTGPLYWGKASPRRVGHRRLFAVAAPATADHLPADGKKRNRGGAAAIVVCDRRNAFDRRDAEAAADLISRWFAAATGTAASEEIRKATTRDEKTSILESEIPNKGKRRRAVGHSLLNEPIHALSNKSAVSPGAHHPRSNVRLSGEQRAAVEAPIGPVLVLAGPGSGKTTVLAHRAGRLEALTGAKPSEFLVNVLPVLTFLFPVCKFLSDRLTNIVPGASFLQSCGR